MAEKYIHKIGRRKTAVASIRLYSISGSSTVNDKNVKDLYPSKVDAVHLNRPFETVGLNSKDFFFTAKVNGGGSAGQLDSIVLAVSRALVEINPEYKAALKHAGLLKRDPRMVERKKTGLRKARKREQYSKR